MRLRSNNHEETPKKQVFYGHLLLLCQCDLTSTNQKGYLSIHISVLF